MSVLNSLKEAVSLVCGTDAVIEKKQPVHGGDANDSFKLFLSNGRTLFLKANSLANEDFFRAEAEGIAAIKSTKCSLIFGKNLDLIWHPCTKPIVRNS